MGERDLLARARDARTRARATVTGYQVGAALMCKDGTIFTGCNVENIVLAETVCAEKVALVKAISEGRVDFDTVAVCTDSSPPATPCGSCRQMLNTWGVERIIAGNLDGEILELTIRDLLPHAFVLEAG